MHIHSGLLELQVATLRKLWGAIFAFLSLPEATNKTIVTSCTYMALVQ